MAPLREGGHDAFMGADYHDYEDPDYESLREYYAQGSGSYSHVRVTSNPINYGTSLSRAPPRVIPFSYPYPNPYLYV